MEFDVYIIQYDIQPTIAENINKIKCLLNENICEGSIILLPETFNTGFNVEIKALDFSEIQKSIKFIQNVAVERKSLIFATSFFKENNFIFNRLFAFFPDRSIKHSDKRHLFRLSKEATELTKGQEKIIIDYSGIKICPLICYDLRFPIWSRNNEDYDLMLYLANWPKVRIEHWLTLLKARAIENQLYTIGVNRIGIDANGVEYSGNSVVFDFNGDCIINEETEKTIHCKLNFKKQKKHRQKYPFLLDRDAFKIIK